jgi:hypothetical protein
MNPIKIEPNNTVKNRVISVLRDFFNDEEYCDRIFIRKHIANKRKRHSIIRERLNNSLCLLATCLSYNG